jgi:hypothetical protein
VFLRCATYSWIFSTFRVLCSLRVSVAFGVIHSSFGSVELTCLCRALRFPRSLLFVSPLTVGHVSFRSFFSSNSSDAVRPGYCISQFSVCFSRWFGGSGWGFPTRCAIFVHREFGCWVGICAFPFSPRRFANVSFARASRYVCFSFPLLGWFFVGTSYGRVVTAFGFLSWINYVSALGEISFFFFKKWGP